ncbi:hypothetical protein OIU77_015560 [Salix suchowensis]|uniref:Uncharacterized protein n=1 Tax=Salix suchowensis TaxID=1278906 RepID=A0ABQ8ZHD0_9ROSI|nr:hypothetical protein OIU77_015560 [Salix suchowensis]
MAPSAEIPNFKPLKKKAAAASRASLIQLQGNNVREVHQVRRGLNSDSLPESFAPVDGYQHLRRMYLLLEEDSLAVERALSKVADEVKTLEDEKFALLDQLVVPEGLIDPSEAQSNGF